jgi:hypothetical protein
MGSIILQNSETINPVYNESIIEFYLSIIRVMQHMQVTIAGADYYFT